MNKIKMLLLLMAVALLFAACNKPDENPTGPSGETTATEQMTEATEPETNLPGVEENQFEEDEIVIPTDPIAETTGNDSESGVTNTGNGNSGSQGNSGNGGSGNQGSSGNQGNSGNGNSGNQGGSGNNGNSGGTDKPTQPTKPAEPGATEPSGEIVYVSYEEYNNMSADEQVAYFNQFPSMEAFVEWYNEAKAEHDEENGAIEIGGDGSVDLGEIVNP